MRRAALIFLLAAGCGSRATDPLEPEGAPDAGIRVPGWLFDLQHHLEVQNRMAIFEPEAAATIAGSEVALIKDSFGQFALVWLVDRAGRRELVGRTVHPDEDYALSPIGTIISAEEAGGEITAGPFSERYWTRHFFYFVGNKIHVLDFDHVRDTVDEPYAHFEVLSLDGGSRTFGFDDVPGGFYVFSETDFTRRLFLSDGRPFEAYTKTLEGIFSGRNETYGGFVPSGSDNSTLLWTTEERPGETALYAGVVSPGFEHLVGAPRELLRWPGLRVGYFGPLFRPRVVLFDDRRASLYALHLDAGAEPKFILNASGAVWRALQGPLDLALIVYATATGVALRVLDHRSGEAGPMLTISEGQACVERIVVKEWHLDHLLLTWIAGCEARSLWFAEVRAFQ